MHLTILDLHLRSSHLQYVLPTIHPATYVFFLGNVDVLQRNKKWFFSRHVQFDSGSNVMTINEFSCDRPKVIFRFLITTCWIILMWRWRRKSAWLTSKNFLLRLRRRSSPGVLTVPSSIGKANVSPFIGVNTSLALSLRAWSSDASISSKTSMSVTMSPFQILPRIKHNRELYLARLLLQTDAIATGLSQK